MQKNYWSEHGKRIQQIRQSLAETQFIAGVYSKQNLVKDLWTEIGALLKLKKVSKRHLEDNYNYEEIYNTVSILKEDYGILSGRVHINLDQQGAQSDERIKLYLDPRVINSNILTLTFSDKDCFDLNFFEAADDDSALLIFELGDDKT